MATDRCIDCRGFFCRDHGSESADFILETLIADVGGIHAHWDGPVNTTDGAFRCVPCLTRRAHQYYSQAALLGGARLPPLPDDQFLRCCVITTARFSLRDPSVDRSLPGFAANVARVMTANRIACNGSAGGGTRKELGTKTKPRPTWRLAYGSGPSGDYSIHVFGDGSYLAEPWHGGELTEVPDAAFASVAILIGLYARHS